jgi:multiple sugar transport system permease protein
LQDAQIAIYKEATLAETAVSIPTKQSPFRLRWLDIKEHLSGYLFILPAVIVISLFGFFPIGYAIYMSTFNWRVRKGPFIGIENYAKALGDWNGVLLFVGGLVLLLVAYWLWTNAHKAKSSLGYAVRLGASLVLIGAFFAISIGWGKMEVTGDDDFLASLPITLFYSLGTVPAEIAIGLILAYVLFQKIRGKELFRMIYFLPYITPSVATAVVFRTIFSSRETSLANQVLGLFGMDPKKWLFEPKPFNQVFFGIDVEALNLPTLLVGPSMALVAITFFGIWTYVGYNTVIFLAGLGSISHELYEAAEIDGANKVQLFRYITFPLLSPITFYLALIAFIGTFKAFNHLYVLRVPSAQGTVDTASIYIFDTFYKSSQYGYAAAQAIILFLIILFLTFVQNKVFGERVFYG